MWPSSQGYARVSAVRNSMMRTCRVPSRWSLKRAPGRELCHGRELKSILNSLMPPPGVCASRFPPAADSSGWLSQRLSANLSCVRRTSTLALPAHDLRRERIELRCPEDAEAIEPEIDIA